MCMTRKWNASRARRRQIKLIKVADLSDEADVAKVYAGPDRFERPLGVIHIAGGFRRARWRRPKDRVGWRRLDSNLFPASSAPRRRETPCWPAAKGGPASSTFRHARRGAGLVPHEPPIQSQYPGVAALTVALAGKPPRSSPGQRGRPSTMDTSANRKAMPKADFDKWPKVEEVAADDRSSAPRPTTK